ncbi:hypothetical protein NECAME_14979 [Necator americanus]|uniref:Uncharacterized protein n=1 Tax=Necator americanus TaxID=51031 RepID=W2SML4_NECAM|nr:hypothetical protein NECAME_14979 [Necator americanus]ETN69957.1 hypothetical protein NECAME_14979 [Necator americanus]
MYEAVFGEPVIFVIGCESSAFFSSPKAAWEKKAGLINELQLLFTCAIPHPLTREQRSHKWLGFACSNP